MNRLRTSAALDVIADLRRRTGSLDLIPRESWRAPGVESGIAKGIVAELLGNAKTEWLCEFFKTHPENFILWCEIHQPVYPPALSQRGIALERIQFLRLTKEPYQALRIALESQFYPFVVCPQIFPEIKSLQRLNLLADKAKSTVFLLSSEEPSQAWPLSLQMEINFSEEETFLIDIHRQKHGASR